MDHDTIKTTLAECLKETRSLREEARELVVRHGDDARPLGRISSRLYALVAGAEVAIAQAEYASWRDDPGPLRDRVAALEAHLRALKASCDAAYRRGVCEGATKLPADIRLVAEGLCFCGAPLNAPRDEAEYCSMCTELRKIRGLY